MDFCAGFGDELAVDSDFSLANEFGGVATGADTAVGDIFVEGEGFGGGAGGMVGCTRGRLGVGCGFGVGCSFG